VDKPPILGVVQREGFVRLIPIADAAARTVLRHLFKNSKPDEIEALYTDDYPSYNFLDGFTPHETVNHSMGEYARGKVHINTVEAEFSVFRPWNATFRGYSKEEIRLYIAQYNHLRKTRQMKKGRKNISNAPPKSQSMTGKQTLPHE